MKHTYRQNRKTHTKVQRITAKSNNRKKRIRTKDFSSLVSYRQKSQKRKYSDDQTEKRYSKLLQVICYEILTAKKSHVILTSGEIARRYL